jgi:hypothetical protein
VEQRSASAPVARLMENMSRSGDPRIFGHHTSNNFVRDANRVCAP